MQWIGYYLQKVYLKLGIIKLTTSKGNHGRENHNGVERLV